MRKSAALLLSSLAMFALLAGCTSGPKIAGLAIEVARLERAADGTVTATLRFVNPNVVAYNIASSTHKLTLNGQSAGIIEINEPLGLPAQQSLTQTGVLKAEKSANIAPGTTSYKLASSLSLRLYGDSFEPHSVAGSGTVEIVSK